MFAKAVLKDQVAHDLLGTRKSRWSQPKELANEMGRGVGMEVKCRS